MSNSTKGNAIAILAAAAAIIIVVVSQPLVFAIGIAAAGGLLGAFVAKRGGKSKNTSVGIR